MWEIGLWNCSNSKTAANNQIHFCYSIICIGDHRVYLTYNYCLCNLIAVNKAVPHLIQYPYRVAVDISDYNICYLFIDRKI